MATYRQQAQQRHEIRQAMRPPFVSKAQRAKNLADVRKTFAYDPTFWAQVWLRSWAHNAITRVPRRA